MDMVYTKLEFQSRTFWDDLNECGIYYSKVAIDTSYYQIAVPRDSIIEEIAYETGI